MPRTFTTALCILIATSLAQAATLPPAVRGARTIYLQAEPGALTITITKQDLNIYENEDTLRVRLFDPLGQEILGFEIPDDGIAEKTPGYGKPQQREETVQISTAGIYRLVVRGSSDLVWGMETSTDRYVVEGGMLFSIAGVSGSVFFPPPDAEFTIRVKALHDPGRQTVPLLDADGRTLGQFELAETGEWQEMSFPEIEREGLWQLQFETLDVDIEINDAPRWTAQADAWFDASKTKWMLLPYRVTRYLQPGESAEIEFTLRNSTGEPHAFTVEPAAADALSVEVLEPPTPVSLAHEETAPVRVRVGLDEDAPAAGSELQVLLQAEAANEPAAVVASGIHVRVGESPVSKPLDMPVVLRPYEHENVQFGYTPEYMTNEVYFDAQNVPWIRHRTAQHKGTTGVFTLTDEYEWVQREFIDDILAAWPNYVTAYGAGGFRGAKVAFDDQGGLYTLLWLVREETTGPSALLFSPDEGHSWNLQELRGESFDVEQFTGHNPPEGPPPILTYERTGDHPARFCNYHDMWLYMPTREGDALDVGEPILVAHDVLGSCQHSGGPASTVTRDARTHIVWGEVSGKPDGSEADERGVPTYVATYDHETGEIGEKVLLGHGPPVNDVHNVPAITMDSEGYLHVLIGAHGQSFHYVRSLRPNDATEWTAPEPILATGFETGDGEEGRQTYISLVCDDEDTLHTAFRQWRTDPQYHGGSYFAALSTQHRPKGGKWTEEATPLVIGAVPGYSIWYHKLTVDRLGDLWLSYSYYTSDRSYQSRFPDLYNHRAVIVSRDGGATWKLAETEDFVEGVQRYEAQ